MPKMEIVRAMFDVRPIDQSGRVDFEKIGQVEQIIDLRKKKSLKTFSEPPARRRETFFAFRPLEDKTVDGTLESKNRSPKPQEGDTKEILIKEFQEEFKKKTSLQTVLAKVGGSISTVSAATLFRKKSIPFPNKPKEKSPASHIQFFRQPAVRRSVSSPVSREMEVWLEKFKNQIVVPKVQPPSELRLNSQAPSLPEISPMTETILAGETPVRRWKKHLLFGITIAAAALSLAGFLNKDNFQKKVAQDGKAAVQNLENAKADIEKLDFASAAENFTLASHNFSAVSDRLNLLGSAFGSFLGEMPGLQKLKSAQNLAQAGENIAQAGENLSLAVNELSKTNFVSYLALSGQTERSLGDFINSFRDSLVFAKQRVAAANNLLADLDIEVIPQEKKESFLDFKTRLPLFEEFLKGSLDYSDLLLNLVGQSGPKKYLVLFQNNTELRATGGFVGSYALADFNRGFLRRFEVKDVYETDGQAKKNIIPPKELQHITPVWGMRDANWFVNFPDSAKKIMQIYTENDGGPAVDGVITLTPTVISRMLEITGPVELPEFQKTINGGNFLAEIQEEVEYGPNRQKPKQILVDFTPKFLEKLGQLDKEKWASIFKILTEGAEQKHILAYFKDRQMEKTAMAGGFAGEIKSADQDYLFVAHTNVKGSKTDAFIDNAYELKSEINERGLMEHSLAITRKHRGGKTNFGFYNRVNYDYVRVLVPNGSKLLAVNGQSAGNFPPLVDYEEDGSFVFDSDLKAYEQKAVTVKPGVKQFEENSSGFSEKGKTVFGFWLTVEPGQTKTVTLKYETPIEIGGDRYSLLVQKQPGTLEDSFSFSLALPPGKQVIYKDPDLTLSGDSIDFQTKLFKDAVIEIKFQ